MPEKKITKVELSNHQIYSCFDADSIHYDKASGKILVGNTIIDNVIINNDLFILKIDDIPVEQISHYVVQDSLTEEIGRINKNDVLENIGGYSLKVDNEVLKIRLGKQ